MDTQILVLPTEVSELANKVSVEKQVEVKNILDQVFTGTADWETQIDKIVIKDVNDKMSITIADVARKNVKQARLTAEKLFDAKRNEVQMRMQSDKVEDSLWLKAKQVMQIKFKAIEEKAEWKAKFVERYEAEQKELRTQLRIGKVNIFRQDINRSEFENMSDDSFNAFLGGLEFAEKQRLEAIRKAEEERIAREKAIAEEQERIRLENIRLKEEAAKKEAELAEERKRQAEEKARIEEEARKERERLQKIADEERKKQEEQRKIEAERARKELEAAQAKAKAEREALEVKAAKERAEAKEKADREKRIAEAKLAQERAEAEKKRIEAERAHKESIENAKRAHEEAMAEAKKEADRFARTHTCPKCNHVFED